MGWTVLYIAFGIVALWLLGEVLLQYKARLRWRLLAFSGFLCVVIGVLLPSLPLIACGAVAFATGQTFVTLSFRRGFSTGWALGGKPGTSKRRRQNGGARGAAGAIRPMPPVPEPDPAPEAEPVGGEFAEPAGAGPAGPGTGPVADYQEPYQHGGYHEPYPAEGGSGGQDTGETWAYDPYTDPYYAQPTGQSPHQHEHQAHEHQPQQLSYDQPYGAPAHGQQQAGQWPGEQQFYQETPADGVWVPQQREAAAAPSGYGYPPPHPEQYPQQGGYDPSGYYSDDQRY